MPRTEHPQPCAEPDAPWTSLPWTAVLGQLREVPEAPGGRLSPSQPWHCRPPGHAHHVFVPSYNLLSPSPADRPPQASSVGPCASCLRSHRRVQALVPPLHRGAPCLDPFTAPAARGLPRVPRGPSRLPPGCSHSQPLSLPSKFRGVFDLETFSLWLPLPGSRFLFRFAGPTP